MQLAPDSRLNKVMIDFNVMTIILMLLFIPGCLIMGIDQGSIELFSASAALLNFCFNAAVLISELAFGFFNPSKHTRHTS